MADITIRLTIKDTRTGLADYDRMIQQLEPIPGKDDGVPDFTVVQWRTKWLNRYIRRNMNRFKTAADKTAVTPATRPDTDVTST